MVDLDIEALHFSVSDCTTLAFVFLIGFEIRMQPLKLKVPPRVVTIVHFIQAYKTEIIVNIVHLYHSKAANTNYFHICEWFELHLPANSLKWFPMS